MGDGFCTCTINLKKIKQGP